MPDATIIYYSSNREDPAFEKKVQETLLQNSGGLPIISVTQKPTDLGKNICVGDVGVSGFNMFRQVEMACQEAKTKFVISAEADCLYPPDYFTFQPERDDVCYRDKSLYVMPDKRSFFFYKKEGATHAQIVGREFYLKVLEYLFRDSPEWDEQQLNFPKERWKREDVFEKVEYYETSPVIQIKTHRGMRYYTHSDRTPIHSLPYWGEGRPLKKKYVT